MNVLFVCTGNTCRSPMAEALLRHKSSDACGVASAGIFANEGDPAACETLAVLHEKGINDDLRSTLLSGRLLAWADVVMAMAEDHKQVIQQQYPRYAEKAHTLKSYVRDQPSVESLRQSLQADCAELEIKKATKRRLQQEGEDTEAIQKAISKLEVHIQSVDAACHDRDVTDPFGASRQQYRKICEEIDQLVEQLWQKIRKED